MGAARPGLRPEELELRLLEGENGLEKEGCGDCLSSEDDVDCVRDGRRECAFSSDSMSA